MECGENFNNDVSLFASVFRSHATLGYARSVLTIMCTLILVSKLTEDSQDFSVGYNLMRLPAVHPRKHQYSTFRQSRSHPTFRYSPISIDTQSILPIFNRCVLLLIARSLSLSLLSYRHRMFIAGLSHVPRLSTCLNLTSQTYLYTHMRRFPFISYSFPISLDIPSVPCSSCLIHSSTFPIYILPFYIVSNRRYTLSSSISINTHVPS